MAAHIELKNGYEWANAANEEFWNAMRDWNRVTCLVKLVDGRAYFYPYKYLPSESKQVNAAIRKFIPLKRVPAREKSVYSMFCTREELTAACTVFIRERILDALRPLVGQKACEMIEAFEQTGRVLEIAEQDIP